MGRAAHLMTQTVTIQSRTGVDAGLTPTYGDQSTIACRVEQVSKELPDGGGQVLVAQHRVISESQIALSDRVWLPGADTDDANEAQDPIAVGQAPTPDGYVLYEAWL